MCIILIHTIQHSNDTNTTFNVNIIDVFIIATRPQALPLAAGELPRAAPSLGATYCTRNHTSEMMLENDTEHPLDNSSGTPLDKWQSF